jgi:predicted PurR-regulated permease PerM
MLGVMVGLAATVVVLVGMHLAAPILNPILFALVLSLLFSPIYAWLTRHRIPTPLALVIMLVGLTVLFVGIFLIMGISIARFSGDIASYTGKLNVQVGNLQDLARSAGLSEVNIRDAVKPSVLAGAIGSVLGGVADFLSNLFLIPGNRAVLAGRGTRFDEQAARQRAQRPSSGRTPDRLRPERGAPARAEGHSQSRYRSGRCRLDVRPRR